MAAPQRQGAERMESDDSPTRLLVMDDDAAVRESIAAYLEDSGFAVLQAKDGREGLEIFRRERPDLLLIDLRMPGTFPLNGP